MNYKTNLKRVIATILICVWGAVDARASLLTDLLINGDFDMGPGPPWTEVASSPLIVGTGPYIVVPESGTYMARLGGANDNQDLLFQDVTVPVGFTVLSLDLWFWIITDEYSFHTPYDTATVSLRDPTNGAVLETLGTWDQIDRGVVWEYRSLPVVGSYAGQTIRVALESTNDISLPTSFFFDSLVLITEVPEPATICLLGLGGLALLRKRRA